MRACVRPCKRVCIVADRSSFRPRPYPHSSPPSPSFPSLSFPFLSFPQHYYEILDVIDDLFVYMFDGLKNRFAKELETVNGQYPFEPLQYLRPSLRLTFPEGIAMLKEAGYDDVDPLGDLSTETERVLGRLVKEKYGTDFYILHRYVQVRESVHAHSTHTRTHAHTHTRFPSFLSPCLPLSSLALLWIC